MFQQGGVGIRILLIESDAFLAKQIKRGLVEAGFVVDCASDGEKGWSLGDTQTFDLAILDLGLPSLGGMDVLKQWRAAGKTLPVVILTACSGWRQRVAGLNAGADDFLEKPCEMEELVARVRSVLRRSMGQAKSQLSHSDIEYDPSCGVVRKAGSDVELTALEQRLLGFLMHRPDRIVSQSELLDRMYSIDDMRDSNTVEVYIARLRKKLGRATIRTVRGMGYRMG